MNILLEKKNTIIKAVIAVVIVALMVFFIYPYLFGKDYSGNGERNQKVLVTIPQGASTSRIAQILVEDNIIASEKAFVNAVKNKPDANLTYGSYYLYQKASAKDTLNLLLNRDSKAMIEFLVPEGNTVLGTINKIADDLVESEVMENTTPLTKDQIIEKLKTTLKENRDLLPAQANGSFEGWLFPAKYDLETFDAKKIIENMIEKTKSVLKDVNLPEDKWEDTIKRSSIVQKEVNKVDDMNKVARVIDNRLKINMPLQMDTIIAFGVTKGKSNLGLELKQSDLDDSTNPYNSRFHTGLPPTPISSPGKAAIEAVIKPEPGDWLYFCTTNPETGETEFSNTSAEFEVSRAKYKAWLANHPEYK